MLVGNFLLLCSLCCVIDFPSAQLNKIVLHERSKGERKFVENSSNREVILHGVNVIVKGYPWIPNLNEWNVDTSLSAKDFATLRDLGVNVIRLGAMWPGVEPTRGLYDRLYLQQLRKVVSMAAEYGIYTLLDMHQDVLSEKFCGEGVPSWAAVPYKPLSAQQGFPVPVETLPFTNASVIDGFPTRQDCTLDGWASYYNTYAAGYAFESLYQNVDNLRDAWASFWREVALEVSDEPSVLGFELINEPWAGDTFSMPSRLIPGVADKEVLQPSYDQLATAIRGVQSDALVFFAAVTWDDIVPAGFTAAPGGKEYADRSVFAFHYYEPPQEGQGLYFNTRSKDSIRLGVGSMLTEFERSDDSEDFQNDGFVTTADSADSYLLSWTMWEFKTFCKETPASSASDSQAAAFGSCKTGYGSHLIWGDDGQLNRGACRKLARTYAMFVPGNVTKMSFDAASAAFKLTFAIDVDSARSGHTLDVFAHPDLSYPLGMKVVVKPAGIFTWSQGAVDHIIRFELLQTAAVDAGSTVTVDVTHEATS